MKKREWLQHRLADEGQRFFVGHFLSSVSVLSWCDNLPWDVQKSGETFEVSRNLVVCRLW